MKKIILAISLVIASLIPALATAQQAASAVILDVRTPDEFNQGHVKGAANIDFLNANFKDQIARLDKKKTYKLYCRSGNRSGKAEALMRAAGFTNIENLGSLQQAKEKLGDI